MGRRDAWLLALCAVVTNLVSFLDRQTMAVLAPQVRKSLDIGQGAYGWLAAAFAASYLLSAPIAGRLLDRIGARRGLLISVMLWSIVAGMHAVVPSFAVLLVLRISLGITEAPALPGASQVMVRVLPPADRSRGLGLLFVGSALGAAIAAPFATSLAGSWGWRWAFVGTASVGLLWVPLWIAIAWRPASRRALDTPPATTRRTRRPVREVLREPAIIRGLLVMLLVSPAVGFSGTWSAEKLVTDHHVLPNGVGHYLWLPPIGIDVGALVFGDLFARRSVRRDGMPDVLLFCIAIAFVMTGPWIAATATTTWMAVIGLTVMMTGASAVYTIMLAEMTARVPDAVSLVAGFFLGAQSLAFIVANPIIGAIAQRTHTYASVLLVIGALPCLALVSWLAAGGAGRIARNPDS